MADLEHNLPCQVQIWFAIEIKFIFEDLVDRISWCSGLWDSKLGNVLPARISCRVWGYVRCAGIGMDMTLTSLSHVHAMETFDELV